MNAASDRNLSTWYRAPVKLWRKLQYPGLAAIVAFYLVHASLLAARLQDDAFISFRYARNLAGGAGLVYNPGERVEGYTNFLWTLLQVIPFALSKTSDPVSYVRAISMISGAGALVASYYLVRRAAPKSDLLPLLPPLLLAGSSAFAINTMTGLETVFFGALLVTATLLLVIEHEDLRYRGSSLVYALAALTRPEAIGLFLLLAGAAVIVQRRRDGGRRYLVRLIAPFAAVTGAHELFRLAYYGHLVPNTFVAKFGVPLPPGLPTPGAYIADFLKTALDPYYVFTALAALFLAMKARDPRALPISIGALFGFVNVAAGGADFMIGFRYLVPYLPLLYVAAALGAEYLAERFRTSRASGQKNTREQLDPTAGFRIEAAIVVLAVFSASRGYASSRDRLRPFEELRLRVTADTSEALGRWMGESLPGGTLIAAVDIGQIGFYSNLPIVDLSGLTDPVIARRPGNILDRSLDLDELFGRGIGGFVLTSRAPGPARGHGPLGAYWPPGSAAALLGDPRMKEGYTFVSRHPSYARLQRMPDGTWQPLARGERGREERENTYFLELYLRKDIAAAAAGRASERRDD
jgi:arabinofuranosyltransferase